MTSPTDQHREKALALAVTMNPFMTIDSMFVSNIALALAEAEEGGREEAAKIADETAISHTPIADDYDEGCVDTAANIATAIRQSGQEAG